MITKIIKRDGREVAFNIEKITNAIYKAAQAVGGKDYNTALKLSEMVADRLDESYKGTVPTVEQVQDCVEKVLVETGHARTAKEYILYRAQRTRVREMNTRLMKTYEDLTFKSARNNDLKRENANIDGDTAMGTMLKYGSEGAKQFYSMYVMNPDFAKAHEVGDIHIHDMDFYGFTTTCCQIDLTKLFAGGFSTGHGFLREPSDIQSYSALACIAVQANQNDQHGGQSIPNFDYYMVPGVKKTYRRHFRQNLIKAAELLVFETNAGTLIPDLILKAEEKSGRTATLEVNEPFQSALYEELIAHYAPEKVEQMIAFTRKFAASETDRSTYQAMEAFLHNLNTMHSRAGAQIPFSSVNYGTDTTPEGRMLIRNLLLATERGLGNGETPIFPIQIFKVKDGVSANPGDPNYDLFKLACKVSAKRLFPNFSFLDAPFNAQYYREGRPETEIAYMGCRTRVIGNYYDPDREVVTGRGNLSFTSINLPRLAIKANKNQDVFFDDLDRKMELVFEQLIERFKLQCQRFVYNFPFLMEQGIWIDSEKLGYYDKVEEVLKHGTMTVGFIGLAEALVALTGKHHGESPESQSLGLEIIAHMRKLCDAKTRKYGLNFSLIATPAEGLSGRFVKLDREMFGPIPGICDRDYYTNSFHVPVYYPITARQKIEIEAPYHELTNGGHITYVELDGDPLENLDAFEAIVRQMKNAGIGYGSINHPVDRDPVCGYTGIIHNVCPGCGRSDVDGGPPIERIRRITGYLVGTLDNFNNAKRSEEKDRVKHFKVSIE